MRSVGFIGDGCGATEKISAALHRLRRALELLASCRDSCTEALMLAHGFTEALMLAHGFTVEGTAAG
jgi:hypothetical protein